MNETQKKIMKTNFINGGEYKEDKSFTELYKKKIKKYIHHIKNAKTFSQNTLIEINNLPYDERLEILINYNEMISYFSTIFENN